MCRRNTVVATMHPQCGGLRYGSAPIGHRSGLVHAIILHLWLFRAQLFLLSMMSAKTAVQLCLMRAILPLRRSFGVTAPCATVLCGSLLQSWCVRLHSACMEWAPWCACCRAAILASWVSPLLNLLHADDAKLNAEAPSSEGHKAR